VNDKKMGQAAHWYASHGLPVFPVHRASCGRCSCGKRDCDHPGKHPRTRHGFKDATTDLKFIADWWKQWPDANIGMPTGPASGLLVLDIDPRNGGEESWASFILKNGPLPETAEQISGGGGRHIFFKHPDVPLRATLADGIDVKDGGGYVILAPSVHPSGKSYQWDGVEGVKALLKPAALPECLKVLLTVPPSPPVPNREPWPEGERNNRLTSLAGTMRRRGMSRDAIQAALLEENRRRCKPPLSEAEVRRIASSVSRYQENKCRVVASTMDDWPEPMPLRGKLPPVLPFSPNMVPYSFRDLIADIADRMQVPMDYPAAVVVVALAGAVNRRAAIQPKVLDSGWRVVPNLWGGIVGRPGFMKSPVIEAVTRPLRTIQGEWFGNHAEALLEHRRTVELRTLEMNTWKNQTMAALKNGHKLPERPKDSNSAPICQRLLIGDATVEALHQAMSENPAGLLVLRDELTGWLAQLEKPGRETERAFCLEAWNGTGGFTMDRVGRGTVHVEHVCMSLFGGIQPGRLRSYLGDALSEGPRDDGLIQRFQVLVWPDLTPAWRLVDRRPDEKAEAQSSAVIRRLVELPVIDPPTLFRFSLEAQELFFNWYSEIQTRLRSGSLNDTLVAHLSKYSKLMPALALLFELADQAAEGGLGSDAVTLAHARQSVAYCQYLESHAFRVYANVVTPQMRAAGSLCEHIKRKEIGQTGPFALRDIYRAGWRDLDTPEAAQAAVSVLEDLEWLRAVPSDRGDRRGRPLGARYVINPKLGLLNETIAVARNTPICPIRD